GAIARRQSENLKNNERNASSNWNGCLPNGKKKRAWSNRFVTSEAAWCGTMKEVVKTLNRRRAPSRRPDLTRPRPTSRTMTLQKYAATFRSSRQIWTEFKNATPWFMLKWTARPLLKWLPTGPAFH